MNIKEWGRPTERRTPMPVNIVFAGENGCGTDVNALRCGGDEILTSPIPSPSVAEKLHKILIIGFSHANIFSSPLRDLVSARVCTRNTSKKPSGELQRSNSLAKGCVARSWPVSFLYSLHAVWNIGVKLEVEARDRWLFVDIRMAVRDEVMRKSSIAGRL
jgi:hypothetical protein